MILEFILDVPMLWFIASTAFLYVIHAFVFHGSYRKFNLGKLFDEKQNQMDASLYYMPLLIVRSILIVKRKIPSSKDTNQANNDDVPSYLYEVYA